MDCVVAFIIVYFRNWAINRSQILYVVNSLSTLIKKNKKNIFYISDPQSFKCLLQLKKCYSVNRIF